LSAGNGYILLALDARRLRLDFVMALA